MMIYTLTDRKMVPFKDIEQGECFFDGGNHYMRIEEVKYDHSLLANAINLSDGTYKKFRGEEIVEEENLVIRQITLDN